MIQNIFYIEVNNVSEEEFKVIDEVIWGLEDTYDMKFELSRKKKEGDAPSDMLILGVNTEQDLKPAEEIMRSKTDTKVVLISDNQDLALLGYEVSAVRFLMQPIDHKKLEEAILYCYNAKDEASDLLINVKGGVRKVSSEDIVFIEIKGRKLHIVLKDGEIEALESMTDIESRLAGKDFIRCHKSFLVNFNYINSFQTTVLGLSNGDEIPISKRRVKEVRTGIINHVNKNKSK